MERESIRASEFWSQHIQHKVDTIRVDNLEKDCVVLHDRIDRMRNRSLSLIGVFAIPIAAVLFGGYMAADEAVDKTNALDVVVEKGLKEVEEVKRVQIEMREGISEIRTGQMFLKDQVVDIRTDQKSILQEIRQMNGRSSGD